MSVRDFSARSSNVTLIHLTKKFRSLDGSGEIVAVNDVNLEIQAGELVTILGPSGCGKTTTLRMIAGFEYPTSGSILIGGRDVAMIPPNKRGLSMVFQSYALFPHLSIYENVAY
ncbi:MAG TPA: polyamine ABC transporter ATP-binding protein, partial [Spirochaetaceae bacterium]|nr:polyamine ABC transporter ATP-binding protein [Spirochaetaceae bacterium]